MIGSILLASLLVQQPASGEQLLEAGQLDRAREAFARALKLDPGQFSALSGMGFIHYSQGRFTEARTYLEKAVRSRPNSFQARFLLGAALVQLNDPKGAIRELRAANKLNPAHADARKLLAAEYAGQRQFREVVALLGPAVDQLPYDEETHLLLIGARQSAGDSAGSFELAGRAARRFPRSPQVAAWLGFQLQFSGRYDEAKDHLRKAIELDPSYPVPYQILGDILLKQEDYAGAAGWFRKAAERMPEDVETLTGLGRALAETGDIAGGIEVLRDAARIAPDNAQLHLQLSRLYFRTGDEENARKEADLSVTLRTPGPNLVEAPAALRSHK